MQSGLGVPARFQVPYSPKDCRIRPSIETPDLGVNLVTASPQVATTHASVGFARSVASSLEQLDIALKDRE